MTGTERRASLLSKSVSNRAVSKVHAPDMPHAGQDGHCGRFNHSTIGNAQYALELRLNTGIALAGDGFKLGAVQYLHLAARVLDKPFLHGLISLSVSLHVETAVSNITPPLFISHLP